MQGVGDLQPGQVDDLLDERGQPDRLALHPLGEVPDGVRVVGRVVHGLGEQVERADRRLQLVAHVGDEVAADLLDPAGLGAVVDEDEHVLGAERRDPGVDDEPGPAERAARELELPLPDQAEPAGLRGHLAQLGVDQVVPADQPERVCGGTRLDDAVRGVEDDGGRAEDGEDLRRHRAAAPAREGSRGRAARVSLIRNAKHGEGADQQADEPGEHHRRRGVHAARVGGPDATHRCGGPTG